MSSSVKPQDNSSPRHSPPDTIATQHLGELDAVGAVLLVAALVFAIMIAFNNPRAALRNEAAQGRLLLEEGRYSEAATQYERTLTRYDSPAVRLGLSYTYLARRDAERAERQARILTSSAPPDYQPAAWAQLGRVLAFRGQADEALDAWNTARERAGRFGDLAPIEAQARSSLWHTAMLHWARGDYPTARSHLEALLEGDDIYATSARLKLAQLVAPTEGDLSLKLLNQAERASPSSEGAAIPHLNVPGLREGLSPEEIKRTIAELRRAHDNAAKARAEGATEAGIAALWGRAYIQQAEASLARLQLERTVQAEPLLSDAHSYLAIALLDAGESDKALDHLNTAIRLAPERPLPRYVLARLYMQRRQWDLASAELSRIRRLEPNSVQLHLQLAEYYTLRGAYELAEGSYIDAVNLQRLSKDPPSDLDAWLALATFYADVRGFNCDRGLVVAQESAARHPGNPASLDALGWGLLLCGQPVESLSSLENAAKAAPESPRYSYHLAKAYAALRRYPEARAYFRRTIDLDPGGDFEQRAIRDLAGLP